VLVCVVIDQHDIISFVLAIKCRKEIDDCKTMIMF